MKNFVRFLVFYSVFYFFGQFGLMAQSKEIVKLKWVNFSPYTQYGQDPNYRTTIPESQIISLLDSLKPWTEGIRTFGTEYGLEKIPYLAKQRGFKVIVGIWLNGDTTTNATQIAAGIKIANEGYADKLIVGCEALRVKSLTGTKIIEYLKKVKAVCPTIPVSYADIPSMLLANPEVLNACDFVSANIYPYWEGQPVECAMQSFHQSYLSILNIAGGKEIFISECGWKTRGNILGKAEPSLNNAIRYNRELLSWSKALGIQVNLFEAFDEPWKGYNDDGWGIFKNDAKLKEGMESVFYPIEKIDSTWICKKLNIGLVDTINIDFLPPLWSSLDLKGHINFIKPCEYKLATFIDVYGGWWTKPYYEYPTVPVSCDGNFIIDFTTGGSDVLASEIRVFLVPSSYSPPLSRGGTISSEIYKNAISWKSIKRCPLPYEPIGVNPPIICIGNSSVLTVSGGNSYLWDNGATTPSITVTPETTGEHTYYVMVTKESGCIETRAAKVLVQPKISYNNEYKSICNGESYKGRTTSCEFTDTLSSVSGCDSIVTTKLVVHHSIKGKILKPQIPPDYLYVSQTYFYGTWFSVSSDSISGYLLDVAIDSLFNSFIIN